MIPAHQKDGALLEDICASDDRDDCFHFWWLGQSGFLIQYQGHRLLFDPYLSDSLTEKYAGTDKPHVRMTEQVVAPSALSGITLVTSSHNHTDHLDSETLVPLSSANPGIPLVLPEANIGFAKDRLVAASDSLTYRGIDAGTRVEVTPFTLTGIPAAHNTVALDENGRHLFLGFIAEFGGFTVFHSGDTLWHDRLLPALLPYEIDVAFHPINGNRPERRVAGNLNGTEAAALAKACRTRLVVPHHFEMFAFNTEPPDEFTSACERLQQPYRVLRAGERVTYRKNDQG